MSKLNISNEVLDILSKSTITETSLVLPSDLDRKLYQSVNKIIELAGGKWNRSAKCHLFKSDPREVLGLTLKEGSIIDKKKERQAFYTPKELAKKICNYISLQEKTVLEPSAGCGNLAEACLDGGAKSVFCIESCKDEEENLKGRFDYKIADFLSLSPNEIGKFDLIVMNPPFTKNQYIKHIEHAASFLNEGGSLYAIVPNTDNERLNRLGAYTLEVFDNKEFKSSGTSVSTKLIEI